jgi:Protein of unknown function DUF262/HNH endonuclease
MGLTDSYSTTLEKTGIRANSMRGRILATTFERVGSWVPAQEIADIVKITPTLGERGGEQCTVKHVMAQMTAGVVARRLRARHSDYRLIIGEDCLALIRAHEESAWSEVSAPSRAKIQQQPLRTEVTPMASDIADVLLDEDEVDEEVVIPQERGILTEMGDIEVDALYRKYRNKKLILQPDFQRKYVWDTKKASKLVESAMLRIPLPIIYLSEEDNNKLFVIDGQQRLTSFFSFIDGEFPDHKPFKLIGMTSFPELNGKSFDEIDEMMQDRVRDCKLRAITFLKGSDEDIKFEMFERLNTGAVQLNPQELRNCIYGGQFNAALKEMAMEPDFRAIFGQKSSETRMKDVEFVLRFCAFYHKSYLNYKPPMKSFLNQEARDNRHISASEIIELKASFKNACQIVRSVFGEHAFKRFNRGNSKSDPRGNWEPSKFNAALYDILMYSFAKADKSRVFQRLDAIREALIDLMIEDNEFIASIEKGTSGLRQVITRFDKWRSALQSVIGVYHKEPRCFSRQLKEELFERNPTCAICGQSITEIDDSAVDHIKQYWKGGQTIPENARLTHRYCNWARARSES